MKVTRLERGWPAHYICAASCLFRRNTLLSTEDGRHYIVSTVGNQRDKSDGYKLVTIGANRHYETMAFRGVLEDGYVDISVPDTISLQPDHTLKITGEIMHSADNLANDMHERNVGELQHRIEQGEYPEKPMDLEETA